MTGEFKTSAEAARMLVELEKVMSICIDAGPKSTAYHVKRIAEVRAERDRLADVERRWGVSPMEQTGFLIAGLDELVEAIRRNTEIQGLAVLLKDAPRCFNRSCSRFATWAASPSAQFSSYGCDSHQQADESASAWTEMSIAGYVRRLEALLAVVPV